MRGDVKGSWGSVGNDGSVPDILAWLRVSVAHKEEKGGGLHLPHGTRVSDGERKPRKKLFKVD